MPILRRNLSVHFQKSVKVTSTDVVTQSVQVSVIPLSDASNADLVATYIGSIQSQTVELLNDDNVVVFSLVPSSFPGLSNPINYRIMWRVGGVTGRTETYDFAMPDADVSFDELQEIGNIIDGQAYLQQSDLGVAGRVARLNSLGQVVNSAGNPVAMPVDVAGVQNQLNAAVLSIQQQSESQRDFLLGRIDYSVSQLGTGLGSQLQQAISGFNISIAGEQNIRSSAVNTLTSNLQGLSSSLNNSIASFTSSINTINSTLATKADIGQNGKIPISQIPPEAITNWIPLQSAGSRFSLNYPQDIQLGDIVLTPSGLYGLTGTDPSQPTSWYLLNQIQSVNGKVGNVVLGAADVGALALNATIPQAQIANLSTTLAGLASTTTTASLQSQINTIASDPKIVKLNNNNQISSSLLDSSVAYVNIINQIVKKDGTVLSDPTSRGVISVNGKTDAVVLTASDVNALAANAVIPQSQINGLTAALAAKADLLNGLVLVNQIPSLPPARITGLNEALAARATLVDGNIPLAQLPTTIPQSRITDLSAIISNNSLTGTSNVVGRVSSLEGRVQNLEVNGGGGGGEGSVSVSTGVTWNGLSSSDIVQNFSSVVLASPFGIYSSGPDAGKWYYNRNGVPSGDAAYPYITANGRLRLHKWNESGPPEPEYALASQVTSLSGSITTLSNTVNGKADVSALNILSGTVSGLVTSKANIDPQTNVLALSQLPFIAKPNPKVRATIAQMQQLTVNDVHIGDICIVSGVGTYILMGNNPSSINTVDGWALHAIPSNITGGGTVKSVSGPGGVNKKSPDADGNIVLQPSDIGAPTVGDLSGYVPYTVYTPAIDSRVNQDQVNSSISSGSFVRNRVDYAVRSFVIGNQTYCATGVPVNSTTNRPFGNQVIDRDSNNGLIYSNVNGMRVLLTNQSDSKLNGIWLVNPNGDWSRGTTSNSDYLSGSRVYPGTLVLVNNSTDLGGLGTSAGTTKYTIWQNSSSAVVDSSTNGATTWRNLGSIAPLSITGSGGIVIQGSYPNINIGSDTAAGFVRKFEISTTPTSSTPTIVHNLNTLYPQVSVIDQTTNAVVLVGWKLGNAGSSTSSELQNRVTFEFSDTAWNKPYRFSFHG